MSVAKRIIWADRKAPTEELNPELSSSERTVLNNAPPDLSSSHPNSCFSFRLAG